MVSVILQFIWKTIKNGLDIYILYITLAALCVLEACLSLSTPNKNVLIIVVKSEHFLFYCVVT